MESRQGENTEDHINDLPPRQRLSRRRSFSDRLEEEMENLKRELDEVKREKDDLEERYRQEREENRLLKKRMGQCPVCSGSSLPTIVQHTEEEDLCVPQVGTEQFQSSPAPPEEESVTVKEPIEDSTTGVDQCRLCSCQFSGQCRYKVKYCHECERFGDRTRCDSFHYRRSRSRRQQTV